MSAAAKPTKILVSAPLMVLDKTSRPHLSDPMGKLVAKAFTLSPLGLTAFCADAHWSAMGSAISVGVGSYKTTSGNDLASVVACMSPKAHEGGAWLMATSFSQLEATEPNKVDNTSNKLRMTVMPLQTPTRSDLKRRQAKAQAPSLAGACGMAAEFERVVCINLESR